ncbi:putative membrane protein [Vibrio cholerae]|nr:putative membrane protein [Vibrio cholerae]
MARRPFESILHIGLFLCIKLVYISKLSLYISI